MNDGPDRAVGPSLLARCPVVPVVVLDHPDQAVPLGEALLAGGIDVIEVTLRTEAGLEAIRRLAVPAGLHVGAGSVLVPTRPTRSSTPAPGSSSAPACRSTSSSVAGRSRFRPFPAWPRRAS